MNGGSRLTKKLKIFRLGDLAVGEKKENVRPAGRGNNLKLKDPTRNDKFASHLRLKRPSNGVNVQVELESIRVTGKKNGSVLKV